jgi:hypothetical protein
MGIQHIMLNLEDAIALEAVLDALANCFKEARREERENRTRKTALPQYCPLWGYAGGKKNRQSLKTLEVWQAKP